MNKALLKTVVKYLDQHSSELQKNDVNTLFKDHSIAPALCAFFYDELNEDPFNYGLTYIAPGLFSYVESKHTFKIPAAVTDLPDYISTPAQAPLNISFADYAGKLPGTFILNLPEGSKIYLPLTAAKNIKISSANLSVADQQRFLKRLAEMRSENDFNESLNEGYDPDDDPYIDVTTFTVESQADVPEFVDALVDAMIADVEAGNEPEYAYDRAVELIEKNASNYNIDLDDIVERAFDGEFKRCNWCDELFTEDQVKNTDLGTLCDNCIAAIRSHGEKVVVTC